MTVKNFEITLSNKFDIELSGKIDNGKFVSNDHILSTETEKILGDIMKASELFFTEGPVDIEDYEISDNTYDELIQLAAEEGFNEPERAIAVSQMTGESLSDIEEERENTFSTSTETDEFLVLTDEEADDEAFETEKDLLDDMGLDALKPDVRDFIYNNMLDSSAQDFFRSIEYESRTGYAEDITHESASDPQYINRLHQEMVEDYDVMEMPEWPDEDDYETEDEFDEATDEYEQKLQDEVENNIDEFVEKAVDEIDDYVEYFKMNFGEEEFETMIKRENLIDYDEVAQWILDQEDRGQIISSVDGNEYEETVKYSGEEYDFYIYKV